MLAAHLALTGAPGVAAALAAMRLGVRDVPLLLGIALATTGVAAFLAFWAYFADPTIGEAWNYVLLLGSIQVASSPPTAATSTASCCAGCGSHCCSGSSARSSSSTSGSSTAAPKTRSGCRARATPAASPPTTTSLATSPNGSRPKATTGRRRSTRPTG